MLPKTKSICPKGKGSYLIENGKWKIENEYYPK